MSAARIKIGPDLPSIVRPNGKLYRPRKIVAQQWENDGVDDYGVFVLGTHDIERARKLADSAIKYWYDSELIAIRPKVTWIRLGIVKGDNVWVYDEVKGRAAVRFNAGCEGDE